MNTEIGCFRFWVSLTGLFQQMVLVTACNFVVGINYVKPKTYFWRCEWTKDHWNTDFLSNRSSASVVHQSMIIYTEKHMSKSVSFCFSSIADLRCLFCLNTYRDRFEYYIRLSEIEFLSPTIIRQQLLGKYTIQFKLFSHCIFFLYCMQ